MTKTYYQPETKAIRISAEHIVCTSTLSIGGESSPGGARALKQVNDL